MQLIVISLVQTKLFSPKTRCHLLYEKVISEAGKGEEKVINFYGPAK